MLAAALPFQIIRFVESRMGAIAPNMSTAIGSEVAARLMGVAGGLVSLSRMPACNVQVRKGVYVCFTLSMPIVVAQSSCRRVADAFYLLGLLHSTAPEQQLLNIRVCFQGFDFVMCAAR